MPVQRTDHIASVLSRYARNKAEALEKIGAKWQENAVMEAKAKGVIKTGRFAASLSYITADKKSGINPHQPRPQGSSDSDILSGQAPANTVVVGSNVNYAPRLELGTHRMAGRPVVGDSVLQHKEEYMKILADTLRGET